MEENKENVVEETTQETVQTVDETKFESAGDDSILKVDLSKPPKTKEDAVQKQSTDEVPVRDESETSGEVQEKDEKVVEEVTGEVKEEVSEEVSDEQPVIEEVTEEQVEEKVEELVEETKEAIAEAQETGKALPDNIQKLVDFMEETGGDINDYVRLNQDYTKFDDDSLLREYYRQTKKHLTEEEINFMMEDSFSYDEEEETEREIKRKKLALKEQVASARAHLDGQKSKYYEEIKAGSKLTPEQQKAVNFFNRYNKESEENQKAVQRQAQAFKMKTDGLFNKNFKGFEYNVGEKKYRFNVKNTNEVKENQSDINNFVKKFLNNNNEMSDAAGYHKSLFTAMNADAVAKHFYEQGRADALKQSVAKSKNVDMQPRQAFGEVEAGGVKVKVLGETSNDFKLRIKNRK
tara:strand:+ start:3021 stop:4238 length:1218 start_codon:yes stop_codon:yes gene_type:complete